MSQQYREPGGAHVTDRFQKRDGSDSALKVRLEAEGKSLRDYKRWRVRWVDVNGRQKTRDFMRKAEAQRFTDETSSAILRSEYIDARAGRTTILDLYKEWEPTTVVAEKTRYNRKSTWKNHLLPQWGDRPVSTIKKTEVQAWITEAHRNGTGVATLEQARALLRLIFKHAVESERILANPATGIKLPPDPKKERCFLTVQQVQALAEAAGEHYSTLILTLATTGLRFGEVSALRVMDVDFDRSRLEVRKAFSDVGGKLVEGLPKSGKTRSVGFPSHLREGIERHTVHKGPMDRVFTTLEGYLLRKENFRDRVFHPAKREASETLGTPLPPITINDLRHTAASLAISSGANVKVLQRMLGHAKADMTLNRYGHLFESDVDSVATRMNQLFAGG